MTNLITRLERTGRMAGICFALAFAFGLLTKCAPALAADAQSSVRSFYDVLARNDEGWSGARAERARCETAAGH